jgi:mono/diheme cytochrome c family protein
MHTLSIAMLALLVPGTGGSAAGRPADFVSTIQPFLEAHCIACHGPKKSKGKITLHTLNGDFAAGQDVERWERILDMLESHEMPPEDEPQPSEAERRAVAQWIEASLRTFVTRTEAIAPAPTTRRLTNFEYENTLRDLLGFRLKVIDNLSKDPVKPYTFNNTAEFMRMGPEQIDRYLETARRAMASAIVAPGKPEVHTTRVEWTSQGSDKGLGGDEVGVWGNRRNTPAQGMGLKTFPKTGAYRIRIKASAILPPGIGELPLRLVMGYNLNENQSTFRMEPVGTMRLINNPDHPELFEFHGRMENHPARPGPLKNGVHQPDRMTITPQNLYDDGTLNDENGFSKPRNLSMPRAVVEWIAFEAPLTDIWPPAHHTRILFDSPLRKRDPEAYVKAVLTRFMSRAYRRPATDEEVARFARIYEIVSSDVHTLEAALRETLAMVLVSPDFLYHTVEGDAKARPYVLASKLSYFLWGSMPDDELMRLAAEGQLDDAAVIETQVHRLIADERSGDFVQNFTMQWLSLAKMKTVPINRDLFPRFLYYVPLGERAGTEEPYRPTIRDYMIDETVGFVAELIKRNASVLSVVDSDFACLNQPLAAHYGVPGVEGLTLRPVAIKPEDHLGGLITQGSILIGNGTGSAPHPIYRAVWLREAILGDEVKPPPADVPALSDSAGESAEHALSIKDLLARHRTKESCMDCHIRLDPWGIPFERYNAIGKFQPMVPKDGTRVGAFSKKVHTDLGGYEAYLESISTVSIGAKARVPQGPEVDGMADLKTFLLKERKDDIARNVLRRLLSYSLGRELTYRDRFAVEVLLAQAKKNEYKIQDMIVSICQSETFRSEQEKQ